jgi:hypothetical protein
LPILVQDFQPSLKTEDEVMLRMIATGTVLLLASVCSGQEQTWIEVLKSDAPTAAKAAACRALKTVGSAESVAAIAPLLSDAALSHEARIALEPMPWAEAAAALRNAVQTTDGVLRAGILDSIGERRDPEAVATAAAVLADDDLRVVTSAALALGKIGTSEAARQLEQAYAKAPAERRAAIGDGLLRCALSLHQAGQATKRRRSFAVCRRRTSRLPSGPPRCWGWSTPRATRCRRRSAAFLPTTTRWFAPPQPLRCPTCLKRLCKRSSPIWTGCRLLAGRSS